MRFVAVLSFASGREWPHADHLRFIKCTVAEFRLLVGDVKWRREGRCAAMIVQPHREKSERKTKKLKKITLRICGWSKRSMHHALQMNGG